MNESNGSDLKRVAGAKHAPASSRDRYMLASVLMLVADALYESGESLLLRDAPLEACACQRCTGEVAE